MTKPLWHATLLTLYPALFPGPLGHSLSGKALGKAWSFDTVDLRAFGHGRHRAVDDTPAGGGAGMVLRADVVAAALDSLAQDERPRLVLTPRGAPLRQAHIREWASGPGLVLLCGRFEGVDERVIERRHLTPVSLGDFILAGGEIPALAILEGCVRLLPGVIGKGESAVHESFEGEGLLEHPHYTRPQAFEGLPIPDVLLSGDHAKIAAWRREKALADTRDRRPDLLLEK